MFIKYILCQNLRHPLRKFYPTECNLYAKIFCRDYSVSRTRIMIWSIPTTYFLFTITAPCGLRGCKNGPAPFPGRMSYKATKPGLVYVLYLSMFFIMLIFIRAPFYVLLVFIVCVVCLLVVLVKLSLLAKLLARKTPLSSESSPLQFLALA